MNRRQRTRLAVLGLTLVLTMAMAGVAGAIATLTLSGINISPYTDMNFGDGAPELAEPGGADAGFWHWNSYDDGGNRWGNWVGYWSWKNADQDNGSFSEPPISSSTNPTHTNFYNVQGVAEYVFAQHTGGNNESYPLTYQGAGVWSRTFTGTGPEPSEWSGCTIVFTLTGETGTAMMDPSIPKISPADVTRLWGSGDGGNTVNLDYSKAYPYWDYGDMPYGGPVVNSPVLTRTATWSGQSCVWDANSNGKYPANLVRMNMESDHISGQVPTAVTVTGFEGELGRSGTPWLPLAIPVAGLAISGGFVAIRRRRRENGKAAQ